MLLLTALLSTVLLACEQHGNDDIGNNFQSSDTWNGSVDTKFADGDGTEASPYEIKTGAQLAYLAQKVNSGDCCNGKYFILQNDIDLNNIEWTPIGNGVTNFSGVFNGNNHSIRNLKISVGAMYNRTYSTSNPDKTLPTYVAGLFGTCMNADIEDLNIDNAHISIVGSTYKHTIYSGILCGAMYSEENTHISNIKISNSQIKTDFEQARIPFTLFAGGAIGYTQHSESAAGTYTQIQADVSISVETGMASTNSIGGLVGAITTHNTCAIENACSYLSVTLDKEQCYALETFIGAFGSIQSSDELFSISNVFSAVEIDKIYDNLHGYPAYTASSIIGHASHFVIGTSVAAPDGYNNKNLFGYVKQVDESTGNTQVSLQLCNYQEHAVVTETNCTGCQTLPENHGFDTSIWNLEDLSSPKLK